MSFHNNNNQFTSTMIDDEDSIEELRRYGEKNLPTLKTSNRKKGSSTANILTDQNREIYLKKLNHYKARENIEKNPSKQYLKTKQINNTYDYEDNEDQEDSDNDVICLEKSEFVQVANAHTSPMSMSTFNYKDYFDSPSVLTSTQAPHLRKSGVGADYVKLKDNNTSLFNSLRKKLFTNKSNINQEEEESPRKEANNDFLTVIGNFIQLTIFPFISRTGLQISKLLPYLVIIIFTVIMLQYFNMKFLTYKMSLPENFETTNNINFDTDITKPSEPSQQSEHFYCSDIKDTRCADTKLLLKELIDYLRFKSGQIDCASTSWSMNSKVTEVILIEKCVHVNQALDYLLNKMSLIKNKYHVDDAMSSVLKAISKNPHWQINLLDETYAVVDDPSKTIYLLSLISSKPFLCRLKELVHFIYVRVIMFGAMLVTLVLAYLIYLTLKKRRLDNDKIYYDLITKVTLMVEKQYELSLLDPEHIKPFIAISHIYDTLFDPSQRQSKKKLWNKIVDFIQDHESRIHLETQFIDGEETHVWKWIVPKHDPSKISTRFKKDDGIGLANSTMITNSELAKQSTGSSENMNNENKLHSNTSSSNNISNQNGWQGDAFNRSDKLTCSPTPCLKIRNMFDSISIENDALYCVRIHNDILEKCSQSSTSSNSILHISCDKKSKESCVYVKCSSNEAAGFVYQQLNGTWYNGRLLNVKFLRSDRYMERFPESVNYNQPLKPIRI